MIMTIINSGEDLEPRMILSYFEDPADPFKLQMPKIYDEAKTNLDELLTLKDTAKDGLGGACLGWN